eukprot:6456479-Prymnesium_polylepis.1
MGREQAGKARMGREEGEEGQRRPYNGHISDEMGLGPSRSLRGDRGLERASCEQVEDSDSDSWRLLSNCFIEKVGSRYGEKLGADTVFLGNHLSPAEIGGP